MLSTQEQMALTMTSAAKLFRRAEAGAAGESCVVVASGPFIIMAYGYMALPAHERAGLWIESAGRAVLPHEIEAAVRNWQGYESPLRRPPIFA